MSIKGHKENTRKIHDRTMLIVWKPELIGNPIVIEEKQLKLHKTSGPTKQSITSGNQAPMKNERKTKILANDQEGNKTKSHRMTYNKSTSSWDRVRIYSSSHGVRVLVVIAR